MMLLCKVVTAAVVVRELAWSPEHCHYSCVPPLTFSAPTPLWNILDETDPCRRLVWSGLNGGVAPRCTAEMHLAPSPLLADTPYTLKMWW
ncbi:hypothetical protein E2C01_081068 [Portunus trituberculatus]|uniref:Uncharacterized protein n=1 Tax=Portunus trituberculatus TaxID=210409 RepID=A0A5B7IUT9_PORTR|nr:hypothetical protein [Portunus trituberculatus]